MGKQQHAFNIYSPSTLEFARGEGARLYDTNGTEYHDCTSGIAVNALGHGHPHLVAAMKTAADGIWHLSNLFTIPGQEKLAARLCDNTFADRVFFTNSGAEAMECALKTARRYHFAKGNPERVNIITFDGAFHGRTLATIAAGGNAKYMEGFGPDMPGFVYAPFDDVEALKTAIDNTTAAILIEPIQGEGGIREASPEFLKTLRELCDKNGILLIFDEIQTGVARTGKLFAHQWSNVEPDIMAIAKGIGAGFPVGACLATDDASSGMVQGTHGSTFGGNPLAMTIGNAVLDVVLEDGFVDSVNEKARTFRQHLAELVDTYPDLLEDVRGKGLLMGMKCKVSNLDVVAKMREHKILVVGAGHNVIRVLPPLVITDEEIAAVQVKMRSALDDLRADQAKG